jgi:hypothetical protein
VLVATTPRFVSAQDWPVRMAPVTCSLALPPRWRRTTAKTLRDFLTLQLRGDRSGQPC